MRAIMITAPSSGGGKTTITMGIIKALKELGLEVSGFKTGPDYIDRAFLEKATGRRCGNLDMHLMGREGIKNAFSMKYVKSDVCVIEGAMGYFDGIYNTFENSSYDISKTLGINTVLVYTPLGEMFSMIPKLRGMAEFEDSMIKGVILNRTSSKNYNMIKCQIEKYTGLKVLGYIPKLEEVKMKSRHLGLVQSQEVENMDEIIDKISKEVIKNIDIKTLIELMSEIKVEDKIEMKPRNIRVAIPFDKAFSFYYSENLEFLETSCEVEYFSPINNEPLPNCDFLYIGGGYPEVFKEEISNASKTLSSIKKFIEEGGAVYGECGGFMYLAEKIEGAKMVGAFKGQAKLTDKLQRFGYVDMVLEDNCLIGKKGDILKGHEFHKSFFNPEGLSGIYKIKKTMGEGEWRCGYKYKNVFAGYPHINFLGHREAFETLLNNLEALKGEKNVYKKPNGN